MEFAIRAWGAWAKQVLGMISASMLSSADQIMEGGLRLARAFLPACRQSHVIWYD